MVKLRAGSRQSYEASELNKISFSTKINLASAKGARLVLKPRWTSWAILPLINHCIIIHYAWAWGPGLVVSHAHRIFISAALFADSIIRNIIFILFSRFYHVVDWSSSLPSDCCEHYWLYAISPNQQVRYMLTYIFTMIVYTVALSHLQFVHSSKSQT